MGKSFQQLFDKDFHRLFFAMSHAPKIIGIMTIKALKILGFSSKKLFTKWHLQWYNKSIAALRGKGFWMPRKTPVRINIAFVPQRVKTCCGFGAERCGKSLPQ